MPLKTRHFHLSCISYGFSHAIAYPRQQKNVPTRSRSAGGKPWAAGFFRGSAREEAKKEQTSGNTADRPVDLTGPHPPQLKASEKAISSTMPSEERSEGSLTDRPIQDFLDAEMAVRDLIYVTNSEEFRDRLLEIISVAETFPPRDRQLLWRRLIVSIGERAAGVEFMQRLAPISPDIVQKAKTVKTLDGKSLWEDMLYAATPVRDSSGFKSISAYLATLPESDYKIDVTIALLSRELTESPAKSLGKLSSIENPTVRRGVGQRYFAI